MRTLALILADADRTLAEGSHSSQLDPRVVTAFAGQAREAFGAVAAALDAIDAERAAEVAAMVDTLVVAAGELDEGIAAARGHLDRLTVDAASAAADLQALRAEVADLRAQLAGEGGQ